MRGSKILTVLNTNTDDVGIFEFSRLAAGRYRVYADKGEVGYLSTRPDIFTSRPALTLVIAPDKPKVTTLIALAQREVSSQDGLEIQLQESRLLRT